MKPTVTLLKKELDDLIEFKENITANKLYVERYSFGRYSQTRWIEVNAVPELMKELHELNRSSVENLETEMNDLKKINFNYNDTITSLNKQIAELKMEKKIIKKRFFFF